MGNLRLASQWGIRHPYGAAFWIGAAILLTLSIAARADVTATWNGGSGNWETPSQWSSNPNYPNNGTPTGVNYLALINAAGTYSIRSSTNISLDGLTINSTNATFIQNSGVLNTPVLNIAAGTYELSGGSLQDATITNSGGTFAIANGGTATFDNVTLGSDLTVPGLVKVINGITTNGHVLNVGTSPGELQFDLNGTGYTLSSATVNLDSGTLSTDPVAGSTLTIDPSTTVQGSGFINANYLINQSVISSGAGTTNNHALDFIGSTLVNSGTIEAAAGSELEIQTTNWDNTNGTISSNGAFAILAGNTSTSQIGKLVNTGEMDLDATVNNAGQTLNFGAPTATWYIRGATINGGNVSIAPTTTIVRITLNNTTLSSDLNVNDSSGGAAITGSFNGNGHALNLSGTYAYAEFSPNGGTVALANTTVNLGGYDSLLGTDGTTGTLTLLPTSSVQGQGYIGGEPGKPTTTTFINNSVINANVKNGSIFFWDGTLTNNGTIKASNGGEAVIETLSASFTDNGALQTDATSTIWAQLNTILASGAAVDDTLGSSGNCGLLQVSGNLNLGSLSSLNLTVAPGATLSGSYEVASYSGTLTGTFSQVTSGFQVSYATRGEILVTAVPEPASLGTMLVVFGLLSRRRQRY